MVRKKKQAVTLLEILIAFALVASLAAFFSMKMHRALQEQRFLKETEQILELLSLAQDAMLFLNQDVVVNIGKEGQNQGLTFSYTLKTLPKREWKPLLTANQTFKTIHAIGFSPEQEDRSKISLLFCDQGARMSQGTLTLCSHDTLDKKDALKKFIYLSGLPAPLKLLNDKPDPEKQAQEIKELTQQLMEEIQNL
jgi:type II secretory pathway pseudopilin PulG